MHMPQSGLGMNLSDFFVGTWGRCRRFPSLLCSQYCSVIHGQIASEPGFADGQVELGFQQASEMLTVGTSMRAALSPVLPRC